MKAMAENDWHTYVDVLFDNVVIDGPDSLLKSALLNGPATPEEAAALQQHSDSKDLAALHHEFTRDILTSEPKRLFHHLEIVLEVLNEHEQNELLREILHRFKQSS